MKLNDVDGCRVRFELCDHLPLNQVPQLSETREDVQTDTDTLLFKHVSVDSNRFYSQMLINQISLDLDGAVVTG